VLTRQEAPSVRLGLLAPLLGSKVAPDHRALTDARATVDVLHALFERLGPLGVQSLTELQQLSRDVSPARRRKRGLADHLPSAPGVYLFRGPADEVLYVGTSVNLRQRVRSYFGAGETRAKIKQMITLAQRVDYVECSHAVEAHIREQRMIAIHQPKYNRRSRAPFKVFWVVLTSETFPRLSIVATPPADRPGALGPFTSRFAAGTAVQALQEVVLIRRCSQRLRRAPNGSPCALAELGRCGAPCAGLENAVSYSANVHRIVGLIQGSSDEVLEHLRAELDRLSGQGRFDQAAVLRDRLSVLADAVDRRQRLGAFAGIEQLVIARPSSAGGWELAVIRYGRLAAAGRAGLGVDPMPVVARLTAASAEETGTLLRWVEGSGTRLVHSSEPWTSPARGAGRWRPFMAAVDLARSQWAGPAWR
jgi:DNA polymerase-3 subunit epsilon